VAITAEHLATVQSFEDVAKLFHRELGWPTDHWRTFAGVRSQYGLEAMQLPNVTDVRAVQRMDASHSWGLFLVDFGSRPMAEMPIRKIAGRVSESGRANGDQPTWPLASLLFIVKHCGHHFSLCHFRGDRHSSAVMRSIGWNDFPESHARAASRLKYLRWPCSEDWTPAWDGGIDAAFDKFFEEIESEIDFLSDRISKETRARRIQCVEELVPTLKALQVLEQGLKDVRIAWQSETPRAAPVAERPTPHADLLGNRQEPNQRKVVGRRQRSTAVGQGIRTPETAFRVPVLKAIVEFGGSARTRDVLDRVGQMLAGQLTEHDWGLLPATGQIRWRNKAQWARNTMRQDGLIREDSPDGIWEITDEGRNWLREQANK